jgi:hypothetical protein
VSHAVCQGPVVFSLRFAGVELGRVDGAGGVPSREQRQHCFVPIKGYSLRFDGVCCCQLVQEGYTVVIVMPCETLRHCDVCSTMRRVACSWTALLFCCSTETAEYCATDPALYAEPSAALCCALKNTLLSCRTAAAVLLLQQPGCHQDSTGWQGQGESGVHGGAHLH